MKRLEVGGAFLDVFYYYFTLCLEIKGIQDGVLFFFFKSVLSLLPENICVYL